MVSSLDPSRMIGVPHQMTPATCDRDQDRYHGYLNREYRFSEL